MLEKEIQLVLACKRNDPKAQTAFYNLYKGRLLGICRRYARTEAEAEDIFQEAFIKIFKNLHVLEKISYDNIIENADSQDNNIFSMLNRDQILEVINTLPDGYRMIINLYLIDGYTHADIAEMLSISEGTSKSQLSRGRELLKKELLKIGYEVTN
jgi:DNA-directed RNA polymerase specialized sigma24 family protein